MNTEYDVKFEEMKKYIPFLDNMIRRLESTSTLSSNPRQAQLDKIRSLRDLLSNKKKRMKMENLLKCEQVLINLYAKVEQRDTLSGEQKTDSIFSIDTLTTKDKSDLEAVRNKLKTVAKQQKNEQDTLPEILARSEVNDVHTSGTKEPALFQRRPNLQQTFSINDRDEKTSPPGSVSKRNYTRVLVSPESSSRRWSSSHSSEKLLFSRRSPRDSPRRCSPSYYKRDKRKSKDSTKLRKQKDLNITLNVPEESLDSLNTKDILSRIINCSDGDVDIDTLRELRKQILGELHMTGTTDDISDLILKSYNKNTTNKPKEKEVEEGELSDSESEAIESIYGSLVVKDPGQVKSSSNKDNCQPRKIQICLVINSDDKPASIANESSKQDIKPNFAELEMYEKEGRMLNTRPSIVESVDDNDKKNEITASDDKVDLPEDKDRESDSVECQRLVLEKLTKPAEHPLTDGEVTMSTKQDDKPFTSETFSSENKIKTGLQQSSQFQANFYKPLKETTSSVLSDSRNNGNITNASKTETGCIINVTAIESAEKQIENLTEIPLLHERTIENKPPESTLSEIDILQALKNEILTEINVPGTEITTPPLHQPKIIKVASSHEIMPKKRISIEKYKEKSVTCSKLSFNTVIFKEDHTKKTSLKLTDKECERFFSVPKISFNEEDDSLDGNDDDDVTDIYNDLAPKSPDHDESNNADCVPPVIIPVDPVKTIPVNYKADVDMRTLPRLSPNNNNPSKIFNHNIGTSVKNDKSFDKKKPEHNVEQNNIRSPLLDPRKKDLIPIICTPSPNPHTANPERTPRNSMYAVTSNLTPNPILTPNARTYEMTPTHQSFEADQSNRKHVYVPSISCYDIREREKSLAKEARSWEDTDSSREHRPKDSINSDRYKIDQKVRTSLDNREDLYNRPDSSSFGRLDSGQATSQNFARLDAAMTPIPSFGRADCPSTTINPYGRSECPLTPIHSFGRLECPATPSHMFGRLECPPTPSHSFGRMDGPSISNRQFERIDCPATPTSSFGRTDCPPTPSHSFGRADCPSTPNHPFGRNEGPPQQMLSLMDCSVSGNPFVGVDCPPTPTPLFGRNECPPTPTPLFGRNECPTPTPLFGRNECPPTPTHPFSPSDCLSSPNHPYGYDRPQTPSHTFGRSDSIKKQCGRSDFNTQIYKKDPRLNRKPESELKSQYDDRDHGFYIEGDRHPGNSYLSQKIYSGSENYRNNDTVQNIARNNKYKYYAPEFHARHSKEHSRERPMGRSLSKDDEKEGVHGHRMDHRYKSDGRNYEEFGSRRDYYRKRSVDRTLRQEDTQSVIETSSVDKNFSGGTDHNKLSVTSIAGRSFTIDTSINATFQKIIDSAKEIQGFVNSFDARRQRATSVGRYLARESSVGETVIQATNSKVNKQVIKREAFRRASSVGRELSDNADRRSFQEIKDEFKMYKSTAKKSIEVTKKSDHPGRSRKDVYEKQKNESRLQESKYPSYSPRRNNRDPRLRKQINKKYDKYSPDAYGRKSGIVYSNDNIVAGSILSSGYGVKNYKIPKIKRAIEEKELVQNIQTVDKEDDAINKEKVIQNDKETDNNREIDNSTEGQKRNKKQVKIVTKETEQLDDNIEENKNQHQQGNRMQTRSSKISLLDTITDIEVVSRKKKHKNVICDSESDNEPQGEDDKSCGTLDNVKNKRDKHDSLETDKKNCNLLESTALDSSFGMDELEIFNDNTVTDPVIDNINALIADLDSDINTSKNDLSHNFTNEISVENMMESISSPDKLNSNDCDDGSSKTPVDIENMSNDDSMAELSTIDKLGQGIGNKGTLDISVVPQKSLCEAEKNENSEKTKPLIDEKNNYIKSATESTLSRSDLLNQGEDESSNNISSTSLVKINNDHIDSTTESEKIVNQIECNSHARETVDNCSTPDSTINTDNAPQTSSNEVNLTGNSHEVTSTEIIELKSNSSLKEKNPALDSIGSLLSILDKSKIKELLHMLGSNTSENEKIKKKLEKLSEIVSDDEESSYEQITESEQGSAFKLRELSGVDDKNVDSQNNSNKKSIENISGNQLANIDADNSLNHAIILKDAEIETESEDTHIATSEEKIETKKKPAKKTKNTKRNKSKLKKVTPNVEKRITRATAPEIKQKVKKPPRELAQLQEDIKEMFIRDEVLSATGIRMCRLAKLVDQNTSSTKEDIVLPDSEPVVILEKFRNSKVVDDEKIKKKNIPSKIKMKALKGNAYDNLKPNKSLTISVKYKAGPKSRTKNKKEPDPYAFDSDSVGDNNTEIASDDGSSNSSDFESESLASSKESFGSTELLSDVKKKTKRKRRGWQDGVIKSKSKKKKMGLKQQTLDAVDDLNTDKMSVPDPNCFTDLNYCFRKNQTNYLCRLCSYDGDDIVLHYRNQHPHVEIPLSRMAPEVAKEAIEQCEKVNFKTISKTSSDKYVCIFCYKEFINCKSVLETFFWHIVSSHTGEFKQHCSQCTDTSECPFKLHIPPPPEDNKRQLIGYLCNECNFTQISLENLKTHVILRHNDNQTAVYTINLSIMTKKALTYLLRRSDDQKPLEGIDPSSDVVVSNTIDRLSDKTDENCDREKGRTRKSVNKTSLSVIPTIQSKITFEGDDSNSELSDLVSESDELNIKTERIDTENIDGVSTECNNENYTPTNSSDCERSKLNDEFSIEQTTATHSQVCTEKSICQTDSANLQTCSDIFDYPHFKINTTESGSKEYFCCINGNYHFKTALLISMKKHVQYKHVEIWDGYCFVCKVIVMPQGLHNFKDCLRHYLDKHMDNFPVFEKENVDTVPSQLLDANVGSVKETVSCAQKINVRPLSELTGDIVPESSFPIIQTVTSLGASPVESRFSPTCSYPTDEPPIVEKKIKYEEHQAEVVSKKYYLVVEAMMTSDNLIKLFKCSGRYCSYVTDSAEEALVHATAHQRIGGTDAMNCSYCDFDTAGNAVDLVMHVFKMHGSCQYCCQRCFYRAISSQAVGAHMSRVHGIAPLPGSVLRRTTVSSISPAKYNILTREQAVSYYICGHSDGDNTCKFRTYTPDKFCEHLEQRHAAAPVHPCHLCSISLSKAADLVHHMKEHGLMLYQCTWCVHGADKENGLLDHISIMHPNKPPQAYIRMITNKEGTLNQRVLPLAFLNKYKVPTKDLVPSVTKEHPEREAKRAIEMEALIGPFMNDSTETPAATIVGTSTATVDEASITLIDNTPDDTDTIQTADMSEDLSETPFNVETPESNENVAEKKAQVTSLSKVMITNDLKLPNPKSIDSSETPPETAKVISPIESPLSIKKEVHVTTHNVTDIFELDSEDEISNTSIVQTVIELSDDDTSSSSKPEKQTVKVVSRDIVYKCPKCKLVCKNMGGFKRHMLSCITDKQHIQCSHCAQDVDSIDKLLSHYVSFHTLNKIFECKLCGKEFFSENYARKHLKSIHKDGNIIITTTEKNGMTYFLFTGRKKQSEIVPKEKVVPKRKLSASKLDVTIPFKRKFEPNQIDQLPLNPILDELVYCSQCEFSTKVRLNMVRHLQLHAEQQPVPQKAPVNPVPHLETNEKHFDKMVNLASSSALNRTPDKPRQELTQSVTQLMPPDVASRYPKYVPERQRHTCGAKSCSYISVNEAMLRRHWDTLHSGTSDFHCVHCPPQQHLDTSQPLTAIRILSHLKMHDATLYACSSCSYYHFRRELVEKHLTEIHKDGRLMVVREQGKPPDPPIPVQVNTAPTMDLKAWQCGLCKFKSMLHPDVVAHCFKIHQSKMQFKCAYCPFRTSAVENVSKHQTNSHADKPEEVFYYFYREGTIPDEPDGTPRWMIQRQKVDSTVSEIKVEASSSLSHNPEKLSESEIAPMSIDLNLVKKEVVEVQTNTENKSIEDLCNIFGQLCDSNGIKFKCPMCSVVMEDTREAMQSHLYEELNYRKWSCGLCSYKAFHKSGLTEHMSSEHRRQYDHIELPANINIEQWVKAVLDYQATTIHKHRNNLMNQKLVVEEITTPTQINPGSGVQAKSGPFIQAQARQATFVRPASSTEVAAPNENVCSYSDEVLQKAFGQFGLHKDSMFCCPKCDFLTAEEDVIRNHLESELNKIRWHCSNCPVNFQTYHEAQFHCKGHDGPSRPMEAIRDPNMRAAWITGALQVQRKGILSNKQSCSVPPILEKDNSYLDSDNSLLVVRYEKNIPTPDQTTLPRKRPAPDSDDETLVIDEGNMKQKAQWLYCTYCKYKTNARSSLKVHMLKHFNMKPYNCGRCEFYGSTKSTLIRHCQIAHGGLPITVKRTELPPDAKRLLDGDAKLICLVCQKTVLQPAVNTHLHNNVRPAFSINENVLKCNECSDLCVDLLAMQEHYKTQHPIKTISYVPYKICADQKTFECPYCPNRFIDLVDFKAHHKAVHNYLPFKVEQQNDPLHVNTQAIPAVAVRRFAKKSTTKLPNYIAKKSTTKLPYSVPNMEEYSHYGTKPSSLEQFSNVTTLMPFCNRLVPFTMAQLSQHLNIEPLVIVKVDKKASD